MSSKRGWMKKAGLALAMALVLTPGLASATGNVGFYLGTGLGGAVPNHDGEMADDLDAKTGFNWELLHLGYNFTDNFGIGLKGGGAVGSAVSDVTWSQGYLVLSGRFSYPLKEIIVPYGEIGLGPYVFMYEEESWEEEITSDGVLGFRFALGTSFYFRRFYIGPEISYHIARYTDWTYKMENGISIDFKSDETGDMFVVLLKLGYHFRR